ncbi:MAG: CheR family methyltransferase, partial [Rhodothermales bacterium]|nr:CheR family methyltransferase [Rhodothermales bacterium]
MNRKSQERPEVGAEDETVRAGAGEPRLRVVGIGGSAGAVRALQDFFDAMPDDCGMAFIVVLHLSPEHKSELPGILQSKTGMRVVQVNERVTMEPDHVYVIPPGKNIRLEDGHLDVADFEEPRGKRTPIDVFFRSHARHHPDGIAVILSGGGADGAVGIKQAKEAGAVVMAQEPEEAEFDSMPRAAIATGLVDVVAPVRELAAQAVAYHRRSEDGPAPHWPDGLDDGDDRALRQILGQLRTWTEHDFGGYKRSTLLRRIGRRMHIVGAADLTVYLDVLRVDEGEGHALFHDLLISVTQFFRDPEAWDALAERVVPRLFEDREADEGVRVWVAGCATGEEAYSVAILLAEHATLLDWPARFQVFATDLDGRALHRAREGVYPEAIREDVSPERLERFFEREGGVYRVSKRLREHVLFAPHNILKDPPFSKLDFVTCRNLLIYLRRELQEHVFGLFQYALRPGGFLFLGSTEAPDDAGAFAAVDKSHRIYRRRPAADPGYIPSLPLAGITRAGATYREEAEERRPPVAYLSDGEVHLRALEEHAPPSLLVNEHQQVLHVSGGAGRFLAHPAG